MVLANSMGQIADGVFGQTAANLDPGLAWVGALAYTFQIYFDFSAYSDMAIGLGHTFGFHFLENFNYPYISRSRHRVLAAVAHLPQLLVPGLCVHPLGATAAPGPGRSATF